MKARDLAHTAQFFGAVSHELRTTLTSVMAFTDILVRDSENSLPDKQKTHLPIMERNNEQLALAIDVKDYSFKCPHSTPANSLESLSKASVQ
jgi:signal transduction histidine kinase